MKKRIGYRVLFLISVLLLAFGFLGSVLGATYYIDFQDGNDNNDGLTQSTAWKTIPGTRPSGSYDSGWQRAVWGSPVVFDSARKVPPGTTFMLKMGTVHDASNGGGIWIDKTYYSESATENDPISFVADPSWGSGSVVFNGTGMDIGISVILIRVNGVKIDGSFPRGIVVGDCLLGGIQVKEKPDGSAVSDIRMSDMYFHNNGQAYQTDTAGAGDGQLNLRNVDNFAVKDCEFDGNHNYINGLIIGDNNKEGIGIVSDTVAYNHKGDESGNDCGIGFKAFNSQVTFSNCSSYDNLKGFDLGEQDGRGRDIVYKVLGSVARDNVWGINMNSAGDPAYSGEVKFYIIDNLVYDNSFHGSNIYAGPFDLFMAHNTYAHNGEDTSSGKYRGNLAITAASGLPDETAEVNVYLYNNIFYKPGGHTNYVNTNFADDKGDNFNFYSDYNSWVQDGGHANGEYFARWSFTKSPACDFGYGADGPGHGSGSWYSDIGCSGVTYSTLAIGHKGADEHSKGTGAADPSQPLFKDAANHDYTLTSSYAGTDLSQKSWYIPEMGVDRNKNTRSGWDIGAYEYVSGTPTASCGPADANSDNTVDSGELIAYISKWKSGTVSIDGLMAAISEWKNGCQ